MCNEICPFGSNSNVEVDVHELVFHVRLGICISFDDSFIVSGEIKGRSWDLGPGAVLGPGTRGGPGAWDQRRSWDLGPGAVLGPWTRGGPGPLDQGRSWGPGTMGSPPHLAKPNHIWPKLIGRIWPTSFGGQFFVDRIFPDHIWPIFFGARRGGGPKGWGPEGLGARRVGGPKIVFFPPPGPHTTTRELQTCTSERPGLQKHHQNSNEQTPRERRKNEISGGRETGEGRSRGRWRGGAAGAVWQSWGRGLKILKTPTTQAEQHNIHNTTHHKHHHTQHNTTQHSHTHNLEHTQNLETHPHTHGQNTKNTNFWPNTVKFWPNAVWPNAVTTMTWPNSDFFWPNAVWRNVRPGAVLGPGTRGGPGTWDQLRSWVLGPGRPSMKLSHTHKPHTYTTHTTHHTQQVQHNLAKNFIEQTR